ncbi:MAG TPA: hypothetical protein DCG58_16690 [Hyphomonas adhaerens]|uniref:DUF885 domain-containing protein n=2 Tax=Hyphomonas adhaerens TaxID=81029 RepID=A0A3B9H277_9PROT|nr:hypothetical protein [Hyphomonas sp.]HAE28799.1 hypothetical protein [Hyphomonas adhaerens]
MICIRRFFAVVFLALLAAGSAQAQHWASYKHENSPAGALYQDFVGRPYQGVDEERAALRDFADRYMALSGPNGDACFYGCGAGRAGIGPNITHPEFRLYLAYTAIAEAEVSRNLPGDAVYALSAAAQLVAVWKAEYEAAVFEVMSLDETRSEADQSVLSFLYGRGWVYYSGCVGMDAPFDELAGHIDEIALTALQSPAISKADSNRLNALRATLPELGRGVWADEIQP